MFLQIHNLLKQIFIIFIWLKCSAISYQSTRTYYDSVTTTTKYRNCCCRDFPSLYCMIQLKITKFSQAVNELNIWWCESGIYFRIETFIPIKFVNKVSLFIFFRKLEIWYCCPSALPLLGLYRDRHDDYLILQ